MNRIAMLLFEVATVAGVVAGCARGTDENPASQHAKAIRGASAGEGSMPTSITPPQTTNLFRSEDLQDVSKTTQLAKSDLDALRAVADWNATFVARPHKDLGRAGPVCPFVRRGLERKTIWLAPEHVADRSVPDVVQLINGYKKLFLATQPIDGDDADYKAIVVVFIDLPADRAKGLFDDVLKQLAVPSYANDGVVMGAFYEGNAGTAIYNSSFRPFTSPAPFLLIRRAVISDWKFFLDNDELLNLWARRYGESATQALAEELRRQPWRARRD